MVLETPRLPRIRSLRPLLVIQSAALALVPSLPDRARAQEGSAGQAQAPGGERVLAGEEVPARDREAIERFLKQHDQMFREGRFERLRELYAADFYCTDLQWRAATRDEILGHWQGLHLKYEDISFQTAVLRLYQSGERLAVACCRPFAARSRETGETILDDFCESLILARRGDGLVIERLFEMDHDKLSRFLDEQRTYRVAELAFELAYPPGFFPIAHRTNGGALDKIVFVDPATDAQIDLSLLDPTLPLDLEAAVRKDLVPDWRCRWGMAPQPAEDVPGFQGVRAEACFSTADFGGELAEDLRMAALYLTPDGRMLFALTLKMPEHRFRGNGHVLTELARSLRVEQAPGRSYSETLFERNPDWQTVDAGFYEHSKAPLSMEIPGGLIATPLAGDSLSRMRLTFEDSPGTSMVLQVHEPGYEAPPPLAQLHRLSRRVAVTVCGETERVHRKEHSTTDVIGVPAYLAALYVRCSVTDAERVHRLATFARDGFHFQLLLLAGEPDPGGLHEQTFQRVLTALLWDG